MREIIWQENIIETRKTKVSITGANTFFCLSLESIIKDVLKAVKLHVVPKYLKIQVFCGMTLPEVYAECIKDARIKNMPRIVFSDESCTRMLSGTKGYECALFIEPEKDIKEIYDIIIRWLNENGRTSAQSITSTLHSKYFPVMYMVANGKTVSNVSKISRCNKKTVYGWLSRYSYYIGTKNRQEMYLKTQLILSRLND